jgi:hypothetical protein
MCSPQNDVPFFVSYIAILGVLFMRDLESGNYLFPLHDNHIMLCMFFILLHTHLLSKLSCYSKIKFRFDLYVLLHLKPAERVDLSNSQPSSSYLATFFDRKPSSFIFHYGEKVGSVCSFGSACMLLFLLLSNII